MTDMSFAILLRVFIAVATGVFTPAVAFSVQSTVLVFARDTTSAYSAVSGLMAYGIPYSVVSVPSSGTTLPDLSTNGVGNYGTIVVLSEVAYSYSTGFASALTGDQWTRLFDYQVQYGVRMVRLDAYPVADFGATPVSITSPGCCDAGVEQVVFISDAAQFPQANMKVGATMSTKGLYHYPAMITNDSMATEIAQFAPGGPFTANSTAAVINNIGGRQQMVWFTSWATDWSPTSNFLQHAWITWATRGLYVGFRRVYFSTQVDDMFLETSLYQPNGSTFRVRPADLDGHVTWMTSLNAKLPSGSTYFTEVGHNGNGNIEAATNSDTGSICTPENAIEYSDQIDTALEFQKALGTGTDIWPTTPTSYTWSLACAQIDPLENWWANVSNRDTFAHVTHTFTHEELNNATYSDAVKEITFNQAWLAQVGISSSSSFSNSGLIPPAITGLHNGDVIRAWMDNDIVNGVGDNTRLALVNIQNEYWPLTTTIAANGYAGFQITPRWATTIYYNCDLPDCTVTEWINTSAGSGDIQSLLVDAVATNTRHLLSLHHDPFMFHQANMRWSDVPQTTINGVSAQYSLLQMWVEVVVQEMIRLVTWPIVSLKHDDIAASFAARMARDNCSPGLIYIYSSTNTTIDGVTVTASGNTCDTEIPATFPGPVVSANGGRTEQLGSDPLTVWVALTGSPVTFTLSNPINI